jgi:hypothetical protein
MLDAFGGAGGAKDRLDGVALDERLAVVVLADVITLRRIEPESVSGRFGVVLFSLEPDGSVELDRPVDLEGGVDAAATTTSWTCPLAGAASAVTDATAGASGSPSKSMTSSSSSCIVTLLAPYAALSEKNEVQDALLSTESSEIGFRPDITDDNSASRGVGRSGMTVDVLVRGGLIEGPLLLF